MFETTLALLRDYNLAVHRQQVDGFDVRLVVEAEDRLCQLDYLLKQAMGRNSSLAGKVGKGGLRDEDLQLLLEIRVYTECFYYIADRLRYLIRKTPPPLPFLEQFEVLGVRSVRNHLIHHPERSDGLLSRSWSYGSPNGPQVKPARRPREKEVYQDRGLIPNAEEFKQNLEDALEAALGKLND